MSDGGAEQPVEPRGDTIQRNAVFAFAAQLTTAAFTAALTVFLSRELGPAGFGIFALAMSVTGLLRRPAAGGTSQAAARFVAERHGDVARIVGVLGMSLRWRTATASAIALALFASADLIADLYNEPDLAWPLRGMSVAFLGQSLVQYFNTIFVSLRSARGAFALVTGESAMEFTATVTLVLIGGGATAAAFGRAVGYGFGAILGLVLLTRMLGRSPIFGTGPSEVTRQRFMSYAGAMLVVSTASAVFSQVDALLIGAFLSATAVGLYSAPVRLISIFGYPGQALAQGIAPRIARHSRDPQRMGALEGGLRRLITLQAAVTALLLVWAEPIVDLVLGAEFAESAEVMQVLAPYVFMAGLGPLLVQPLNYAGEGRRRIPVALATVALLIGLDVILIPEFELVGAAIATDISFAVYLGGHLWLSHRLLGLRLRPLAVGTARSLAAAAALAAVLALAGTGELSPLEWLWGSAGGAAALVGMLHLTGELPVRELVAMLRSPYLALRSRSD